MKTLSMQDLRERVRKTIDGAGDGRQQVTNIIFRYRYTEQWKKCQIMSFLKPLIPVFVISSGDAIKEIKRRSNEMFDC